MASIELDVVVGSDQTLESAARELAGPGLAWRVLTEHGSGGGWPVIVFTGTREGL
jgi:hypothetical protein